MKVIILAIIPIVGFAVGWALGQTQNRRVAALGRSDRKELSRLRHLRDVLTITAAEHSAMGEPGAVIMLDQINESRENGARK